MPQLLSKAEREKLIKELANDEVTVYTEDRIVAEVSKAADVTADKVLDELKAIFPEGLPKTATTIARTVGTTNGPESVDPPASAYTRPDSVEGVVPTNINTGKTNVSSAQADAEQIVQPDPVSEKDKGRIKPADYKVDESEARFVHLEVEQTKFNPVTGTKESRPKVVKLTPPAFLKFRDTAGGQGYSHVVVLHKPKGINLEAKAPADLYTK